MSEEPSLIVKLNRKFIIGIVVIITIALIVVFVFSLSKSAEAKKLEEQLDLGAKYLSELQYEQAIAAYLAAIEIDSRNVDAYLGLADAYVAMGEYEKAIEVLEDALNELSGDEAETVRKKLDEVRGTKTAAKVTATSIPTPTLTNTPVPESTGTPTPIVEDNSIANAEIGDVVKFGRFMQMPAELDLENAIADEKRRNQIYSISDEIEWYVLDRKEDKILLFSKYVLDTKPYHKEHTEVTWAQSSIREWLNNTFYSVAFSEEEKEDICKTKLLNSDNDECGSVGGGATVDNVFLLSIEEAKKYFHFTYDSSSMTGFEEYEKTEMDKRLIGVVTYYAIFNGSMNYSIEGSEECSTMWYLRSPGRSNLFSAYVESNGFISTYGYSSFYVDVPHGIRPAIWVDVSDNSNDGAIFDLTDGEEENADRIFHSLTADHETLLSFDELNFLGHSIVDLDIYTVQNLLEENNHNASCSSFADLISLTGYPDYGQQNGKMGIAHIMAWQNSAENYVNYLQCSQDTYNNEMKSPIGVRNINLHDTFGEVLEKIGFSNAYEVEADMEYFFSEYCDFENDISDESWNAFHTMTDYNKNGRTAGLVIDGGPLGYGGSGYSCGLTLSDTLFEDKNGNKRHSVDLEFELDENTNGKFILTRYTLHVD